MSKNRLFDLSGFLNVLLYFILEAHATPTQFTDSDFLFVVVLLLIVILSLIPVLVQG